MGIFVNYELSKLRLITTEIIYILKMIVFTIFLPTKQSADRFANPLKTENLLSTHKF